MRKGQMSLEMIIGLLILLVVAVVVIRMFLGSTESANQPWEDVKTGLKWKDFKSECESYCSNFKISGTKATLAKYCYTKLTGDTDLNRNAMVDSLPADTKILEICEDSIYCFHIYECRTDTDLIDWDDCREIVCQSYYDVYKDWDKVDEKVLELFPSEGSCNLPEGENWWEFYFGIEPCTNPGTPPSEYEEFSITQLQDCQIDVSDSTFSCNAGYTGTCNPEDFIFMAYDAGKTNLAGASPGNDPPLGSVIFENNVIRGTVTMGPSTLSLGSCYDPRIYCDMDKDGNPEVNETTSVCEIVQ